MKTKISLLFIALAFTLQAQWNKTFNVNMNDDNLVPSFVIPTFDLGSACVSWGNDSPGMPRRDYFIVTKNDAFGGLVFNTIVYPNNMTTDGFTSVEAMIETKDNGILIAGYYYYDNSYIMQPFLVKLDVNGAYQWTQWYPSNTQQFKGFLYNKISLCRVEDDPDETYFIVCASHGEFYPNTNDAVQVLKVKNNGGLIWSKKYFDSNVPPGTISDIPGDIAYSPSDNFYMITGWRQEHFDNADRIFFFGIDRDGNVVTYYKSVYVPGCPKDEDMVWDPNNKVWAVTYSHDCLDPNDYNFTYSTIGLITIDAGLNIFIHNMYWHPEAKENRGLSISLSVTGDYVIGCDTYDGQFGVRNPSLLKVDNAGNPISIMKYNIYDDVLFGHHCNSFNPNTGSEEYVMVNLHKTDLRVIRTDINTKSCGAREYDRIVKVYDFKEKLYKYYPKEIGGMKDYEAKWEMTQPEERECTDATYDSYRPSATGIASVEKGAGINVYPNQISASTGAVTVENSTGNDLQAYVTDITGKQVLSGVQIKNSKTTLPISSLAAGVYMLHYQSANGAVMGTKKIIISE